MKNYEDLPIIAESFGGKIKTEFDKGYEVGYKEAKEVLSKTPTTPAKEQVYEIISKMPSEYADFYSWGMSDEITEFIITEWEKIRNSPK